MSDVIQFPVKDPIETLDYPFLEAERLDGATIVPDSITVAISSATEAIPTLALVGLPVLNATFDTILLRMHLGTGSTTYHARVEFDTSDGQHMVEVGVIPVRVLG